MPYDYERDTRGHYQSDDVARQYHEAFASQRGMKALPFRLVAERERRTIGQLLEGIPHGRLLDIPAGTGKLAGVFAHLGSRVMACDVSANMLKIAEGEYRKLAYGKVEFRVADASDLSGFGDGSFEAVVCLRLMHRVPGAVRRTMLAEFARVAPRAIVSFGIDNGYHKARRYLRNRIFDAWADVNCFCSLADALADVGSMFEVRKRIGIAPGLSREVIFLLESRAFA